MDEHKNEVPYKVEPVNDSFQLDIGTIDSLYDPDFQLKDITELINRFKVETLQINGAIPDGSNKAAGQDNE